mmetsp:Transcript_16144/g.27553  ORF Transcript_16144/g.27553 Transcript_16144/m.27553 type:complete len:93 (+) Transcript_16144:1146-1424(+)
MTEDDDGGEKEDAWSKQQPQRRRMVVTRRTRGDVLLLQRKRFRLRRMGDGGCRHFDGSDNDDGDGGRSVVAPSSRAWTIVLCICSLSLETFY